MSFASVAASAPSVATSMQNPYARINRQEADYWFCRRSIRLWPAPGPDRHASVYTFLQSQLQMDHAFLSQVTYTVIMYRTPRSKVSDEVLVTFDTIENRDCVRAAASALGGARNAGIRVHIPRHLQAKFKQLDRMCFSLKASNPNLRRSIKFDDDIMDIFADVKSDDNSPWKRMSPEDAKEASDDIPSAPSGPARLTAGDMKAMLKKGSSASGSRSGGQSNPASGASAADKDGNSAADKDGNSSDDSMHSSADPSVWS